MDPRSLPCTSAVASMLGTLLGKPVLAKPTKATTLGPRDRTLVGLYVRDDDSVDAVIVCDLAAAAALGCALALIHPSNAAECVKRGKLDEALLENLREVLNVMAGLVNHAGVPRLRLQAVVSTPPVPPSVVSYLTKRVQRLDVTLTVEGYASGTLSILVSKESDQL